MLAENFAEQGGGRRNTDVFRGQQRSYAEFYTTDVKVFYLIIVLSRGNGRFVYCKRLIRVLPRRGNDRHVAKRSGRHQNVCPTAT